MTTTYQPFREVDIPIACHTAREAIVARPELGDPGDRGREVWQHASISGTSDGCQIIRHRHHGLVCCTHPSHRTFNRRKPCRHLSNWLFWREYDAALAHWRRATAGELRQAAGYYALIAGGVIAGVRGWQAEQAALGEVIGERMAAAVAA